MLLYCLFNRRAEHAYTSWRSNVKTRTLNLPLDLELVTQFAKKKELVTKSHCTCHHCSTSFQEKDEEDLVVRRGGGGRRGSGGRRGRRIRAPRRGGTATTQPLEGVVMVGLLRLELDRWLVREGGRRKSPRPRTYHPSPWLVWCPFFYLDPPRQRLLHASNSSCSFQKKKS
jgi:hypothetical protein